MKIFATLVHTPTYYNHTTMHQAVTWCRAKYLLVWPVRIPVYDQPLFGVKKQVVDRVSACGSVKPWRTYRHI